MGIKFTFNPFTSNFDAIDLMTLGNIDGNTPSPKGASIVDDLLYMQSASATNPGIVNTGAQSFAGDKTFSGMILADGGIDVTGSPGQDTLNIGVTPNADFINIGNTAATVNIYGDTFYQNVTDLNVADKNITVNHGGSAGTGFGAGIQVEEGGVITGYVDVSPDRNSWEYKAPNTAGVALVTPGASGIVLDQSSHNPVTLGTANGLSLATQVLSLALSSTSTTGALSSTDWNTFNNKQNALTIGDLTDAGTDGIIITSGTGAVIGTGTSIAQTKSDASHNGYLSSTDWSTFNSKQNALTIGNISDAGTDGITVTGGTGAIIGSGVTLSQHVADSTHNGYLSSTDWSTFNSKQAALTFGNLTASSAAGLSVTGGTGAVIGSGSNVTQAAASASQNGYLLSTDWSTFNSKQAAGNYITALTGDATASGPGSAALTLATVNSNVGTFGTASQVSTVTVNAKGLVTAASNTSIQIAESQVTNLSTDLASKIDKSLITAKGDLIVGASVGTPATLSVGTYGQVPTANPNATNGINWTGPVVRVKNFIQYGNFENNATTGWSLAHTTLSNLVPNQVAGSWTSASGNLSFATSSSSPLAGTYSGVLTSSAATVAGDMLVSQAYTLDQEYQGKVLTIKLYYKVTSGASNINMSSTSANTFQIYIYDTTNSIWIQPAGAYAFNQNSGVGFATATFQTASNAGQFQLAIVSTNASAGACAIAFDDITVSSVTAPIGPVVTDFQSFPLVITAATSNPTPNAGATKNAYWRRVGDSMEIMVDFYQTSGGSAGSGVYIFNMPVGYTIDTSKAPANSSNINGFSSASVGSGVATNIAGASSTSSMANVIVYNSTGLALVISNAATTQTSVSSTIQPLSNGTLWYSFRARVPIVGWSSNVQMSNDTDTRVISFYGNLNGTQTLTANVTDAAFTTTSDNTASWTGTQFNVPVAGNYFVSGCLSNANPANPSVYVNGSLYTVGGSAGGGLAPSFAFLIPNCKAGDFISLRSNVTGAANLGSLNIFRLSGPSVIAATESVNMAAVNASSQTIPNATFTTLTNWTKDFDSHNAFNATTGVYTVPVSGKYLVTSIVDYNPTGVPTVSAVYQANVSQSGSVSISRLLGSQAVQVGAAVRMTPSGSYILNCVAGDSIVIQAWQNSNASQPLTTVSNCSIERIGN